MSAIGPAIDKNQFALTPRSLPQSPFTPTTDVVTLGKQIEIAAAACVRFSRTIGLIYFEIPSLPALDRVHGIAAAEAIIDALAEKIRRALRPTDHVAVINRNQIIVCISLLANASDLKSVAARIYALAQRHELGDSSGLPYPPGYAIYPLNGYDGASLIEAAREDFQGRPDEIHVPPLIEEKATPALPTSAKKRASRRTFRKKPPSSDTKEPGGEA
jgi:GGDEF domain-containing protein